MITHTMISGITEPAPLCPLQSIRYRFIDCIKVTVCDMLKHIPSLNAQTLNGMLAMILNCQPHDWVEIVGMLLPATRVELEHLI